MKTNGSDASKQVASKQTGTLGDWMNSNKASFLSAIPKGTIEVDRFVQSAVMAITNPKNPLLRTCTKDSLFRALRESASYGLEVSGILGQAYLIPYNENVQVAPGKWEKQMTCHFQISYKGLIELARRSNTIKTIAAEPIHENDIIDIELGMNRHLSHKIDIFKERGEVIGYYCLVELNNGGCQFTVSSKKDIEQHRDKFSKAYKKDDKTNVWNTNFDAMALKTQVIKTLKLCPISIAALDAIAKEEITETIADENDYSIVDEPAETSKIEEPKVVAKPEIESPKNIPSQFDENNSLTPDEDSLADETFSAASEAFDGDVF